MGKHSYSYAEAFVRAMNHDVTRPYDADAYADYAWLTDLVYADDNN